MQIFDDFVIKTLVIKYKESLTEAINIEKGQY